MLRRALFAGSLLLVACGPPCSGRIDDLPPLADGPAPSDRCPAALDRFLSGATGAARALQIADPIDLIGGPNAHGRIGDWLLANERIRVVIQGPDRHIGPQPYGGTIIDADLVRPGAGRDELGEIGLVYNFGRTLDPISYEIVADGSDGRAAILAVTGPDAPNDYLNIRNQLRNTVGKTPVTDPYVALPLKVTSYFILEPNDQRVRMVTAFCNQSPTETLTLSVGDLVDPGYSVEFFNPQSCTGGFGYGGLCFGLDRMSWFGYLGASVAYGYAPYQVEAPTRPEPENAVLTIAGVTATVTGAPGLPGVVAWFDANLARRAGQMDLLPKESAVFARDFFVAPTLGDVATLIETTRSEVNGAQTGEVSGTVTSGGRPLAGARVSFRYDGGVAAVFTTDASGQFRGRVQPRSYQVSAWAKGHDASADKTVSVSSSTPASVTFELVAPRKLTVTVREVNGGPMPAKVTVLCASGVCPSPPSRLLLYTDATKDPLLDSMQHVGFVGASGGATFELPPAQYTVLISRGPEYSLFQASADLRFSDATVNAALARVLDTSGYLSADFHVHAVNSPDSPVENVTRALGFAADGVDILVSTDHDYVTDFGPYIDQARLRPFLGSIVGEEVSTMDWGHYNVFPLRPDPTDVINGGAIDWAGGRGPTLTPVQLFAEARRRGARTIHFNHPRGFLGGFTFLRVDTDTLATHADPAELRMATPEGASPADTKLLSPDFNAMEVMNSGEDEFEIREVQPRLNDWFTLLSRGLKVAATGTSDTHTRSLVSGYRTYVATGTDSPGDVDPHRVSDALNALRAVVTNGPFVTIRAYRVNAAGAQVTPAVGLGDVVPPSNDDVGVTVEVQVPDYLDVTRIELYTHTPADDARCPIDPQSPRAATTRVACDGQLNRNWPSSSIAASQAVALTAGDLETAATENGVDYRRYRKAVQFRLPRPATDNWVVALVYGSKSLFPLVYVPASPGRPARQVTPLALTNPVFIDADGGGYDKPPFRPTSPMPPAPLPGPTPALSERELLQRWGDFMLGH